MLAGISDFNITTASRSGFALEHNMVIITIVMD